MIEIKCKTCREWKPAEFFSTDPTCKSGRRGQCRKCRNDQVKERQKMLASEEKPKDAKRLNEVAREKLSRDLCSAVQTYWHVAMNTAPLRATIGGGYV